MTRRRLALALGLILAGSAIQAQSPERPGYIGSGACVDCHTDAAAAWAGSGHARSWRLPDPELAPEGDHGPVQIHWGPDGPTVTEAGQRARQPMTGIVGGGSRHRYLRAADRGRLVVSDVTWGSETGAWTTSGTGAHGARGSVWNTGCATCHATNFVKNFNPATESYDSSWSEAGIGCESCHGPGEAHADWAQLGRNFDHAFWTGVDLQGLLPVLTGDAGQETELCAGCHARRTGFSGDSPAPGAAFADSFGLTLLQPGAYFADGQIDGAGFTYGAFLQSKEARAGVRCSDCHAPHSTALRAKDNGVCTQCHRPAGTERFPDLPGGTYDTPAHTLHAAGSPGGQCVACHMPRQDGPGGPRHDHSFRIPRPDLAASTGAPDTCTTCHTDRDSTWAAQTLARHFPASTHRGPHYGPVLARARRGAAAQDAALTDLALEPSLPGIVRATALSLLCEQTPPALADRIAPLLHDPDPLIRAAAAGTQRTVAPAERAQRLAPLLSDPMQSVRLAAVTEFLDAPRADLPDRLQRNYDLAVAELRDSLRARADRPEAQFRLGRLERQTGNYPKAVSALEKAVSMDPNRSDGWLLLIDTQMALGRRDQARATLADALRHIPDDTRLQSLSKDLAL